MQDRLVLLHALRLALIHRIWLLAVDLPEFSPRHGATREALVSRILQLDVEPVLTLLDTAPPASGSAFPPTWPRHCRPVTGCGSRWMGQSCPRQSATSALIWTPTGAAARWS